MSQVKSDIHRGKMGWFSSDEIVTNSAVCPPQENYHLTQAIALAVLAGIAVGYIVTKIVVKAHKNHTIRVAERAVRVANV